MDKIGPSQSQLLQQSTLLAGTIPSFDVHARDAYNPAVAHHHGLQPVYPVGSETTMNTCELSSE